MDEVAKDVSAFEDLDPLTTRRACGEIGEYARVGVGEGLSGAVHVLQAEDGDRYSHRTAPGSEQVLLGEFGPGIDVGWPGWRRSRVMGDGMRAPRSSDH